MFWRIASHEESGVNIFVVDLDDSYHWQLLLFCLIVPFLFHALLHTCAKAPSAASALPPICGCTLTSSAPPTSALPPPSAKAPSAASALPPMLLHPHFFCAADERLATAKRQSAFSSVRLAAYAAALALLLRRRRAPCRRQACALAFASLRLRLDCFYTCTFTPGLRPFLTASAPASLQFLFER